MAKKALLDVLEQTIGKYVLNLDSESLNVAVWSGKIELNSLELNIAAVNGELDRKAAEAPNLAFPFRVVSGKFGNFTVDVPWASLTSKSVILRASSLKVGLEPYDRTASADFLSLAVENESLRAKNVVQQRQQSLLFANDSRLRRNALKDLAQKDLAQDMPADSGSESFSTRLVRRIIENLQIEINDVHFTVCGDEYSAGIVLKSLQLVTTDEKGNQTFVDRTKVPTVEDNNSFLYKSLAIRGLGVYLDDDSINVYSSCKSIRSSSKSTPLQSIDEESNNTPTKVEAALGLDHSYILAPLSFEASLRQADSRVCVEFPKYLLRTQLNALSVLLSRRQVELASLISQQVSPSRAVARPLFPEYRPLERVSSHTAVEWWKYANRCIGRLNGRRSWNEFFVAFQKRKQYVNLYKRLVNSASCTWLVALNSDEAQDLERIENDRSISVDGIMQWRNIADAQVRKEKEKHAAQQAIKSSTSIFSSLFGSSTSATAVKDERPPIELSTTELIELEQMHVTMEPELSLESKLYDFQFILGSLRIHLSSFASRQLASLNMGTVSATFRADKDGTFDFDFGMSSLILHDKFTANSFFPKILSNQSDRDQEDYETGDDIKIDESRTDVFQIRLSKTTEGHQNLTMKLSTFNIVASPIFLREFFRFIKPSKPESAENNHVMLARSMSGSVDLFYDANDGATPFRESISFHQAKTDLVGPLENGTHVASDISRKLIEVWNLKTEAKTTWTIDLDLQAPIIFLPESCTDAHANILVFDLGHLRFTYGKSDESGKVNRWFDDNPRIGSSPSETQLDFGCVLINSLSFTVGKVFAWRNFAQKEDETNKTTRDVIIEPLSLKLNLGIESCIGEIPRVYAFGILRSVSLRLAQNQVSRIMSVVRMWSNFAHDVTRKEDVFEPTVIEEIPDEDQTLQSTNSIDLPNRLISRASMFVDNGRIGSSAPFVKLHVDMRLQRLSINLLTKDGGSLEANLVSVAASTSVLSDGSSGAILSMGWFWVLDNLEYAFPRTQRIIAHSKLPSVPAEVSSLQTDQIVYQLECLGVFAEDFEGSSELVDISYKQRSPQEAFGSNNPFSSNVWDCDEFHVDGIIDAHFASLFVNWNPKAIKKILVQMGEFFESVAINKEPVITIVPDVYDTPKKRRYSVASSCSDNFSVVESQCSTLLVRAKMAGLHLTLNSAIDDLPIFTVSMARAKVSMVSEGSNRELSLALGELKVVSPEMGTTHPSYRTVLGLKDGTTESLLTVKYYSGAKAVPALLVSNVSTEGCESFGAIELSPMRMVYIQAQVLALVEYFTVGVLGAMATQAAASAVQAAAEIVRPASTTTKFVVTASSLELVIPTAACKTEFLSLNVNSIHIEYTAKIESGGTVLLSLTDVQIHDSRGGFILPIPVRFDLDVSLPPLDVGNKNDQALRVKIIISRAPFTLSKLQYSQIFAILGENIGEMDLCLRNSKLENVTRTSSQDDIQETQISHAGNEIVYDPRWIFLNVDMNSLSLELRDEDNDDTIVQISAVEASVGLTFQSDLGKMSTVVILRDLFCDDKRDKSFARTHRSLIYQSQIESEREDAFVIAYATDQTNKLTTVDLKVGSPRFVVIPDAISDVLNFFSSGKKASSTPTPVQEQKQYPNRVEEVVAVCSATDETAIETTFVRKMDMAVNTMEITLTTSRCAVMFVDLGTDTFGTNSSLPLMVRSVTETVVLGGTFSGKAKLESRFSDGTGVRLETEFRGDDIELFTSFGLDLHSAVQIVEPFNFAFYYDSNMTSETSQVVNIQMALLTSLEISLSMRNIALIKAVTASLLDSFEDDKEDETVNNEIDWSELDRVARLTSMLEKEEGTDSEQGIEVTRTGVESDEAVKEMTEPPLKSLFRQIAFKLTTADMLLTVVNDLQGLDEALLRMSTRNFVANGQIMEGSKIKSSLPPFTAFVLTFHASLLSDYFDVSSNSWKKFLLKSWDLSMNARRGVNELLPSKRPSTTIDIESLPCHISFSEQFITNAAAASRMWTVFSAASESAIESASSLEGLPEKMRRTMAASAARTFVASLPYAVENKTGVDISFLISGEEGIRCCKDGTVEFFRFEPPKGKGTGGARKYGQDVKFNKSILLFVGDTQIEVNSIDTIVGKSKRSHIQDGNGLVIMTHVSRDGKTITLHVSSGIEFQNRSCVPFSISILLDGKSFHVGKCGPTGNAKNRFSSMTSIVSNQGNISRISRRQGVSTELSRQFRIDYGEKGEAKLQLIFTPEIKHAYSEWELCGATKISVQKHTFSNLKKNVVIKNTFDVTCHPVHRGGGRSMETPRALDRFVFQATIRMSLIDNSFPTLDISIEPRASFTNKLPVGIHFKSPMPYVFGSQQFLFELQEEFVHNLEPESCLEIFTPGPSIAISVKCSELPVGGTSTDWMEGGWVDLPLVPEVKAMEAISGLFPFVRKIHDPLALSGVYGSEFLIVDGYKGEEHLAKLSVPGDSVNVQSSESNITFVRNEEWRSFFITVRNYAIDHTGSILFEQVESTARQGLRHSVSGVETRRRSMARQISPSFGAYAMSKNAYRLSLLPTSNAAVRLLNLSMQAEDGLQRTLPFELDYISVSNGGVDSTPLKWENGKDSGFYAYRKLINNYQAVVHIVPEYIIYNGSNSHVVYVRQSNTEVTVQPERICQLKPDDENAVAVAIEYPGLGGRTPMVRIDSLGLRIAIIKAEDGTPIARVAIQTVVGGPDSRLVVKLGDVQAGPISSTGDVAFNGYGVLDNDFFRLKIKWTELQLTVNEAKRLTETDSAFMDDTPDGVQKIVSSKGSEDGGSTQKIETWVGSRKKLSSQSLVTQDIPLCTICFRRFTVDWQRIFKDDSVSSYKGTNSLERSQLSVVIHHVQILDDSRGSIYPVVFDSTSRQSFFDLCIRLRGPANSDLVVVDLVDLNVAHRDGFSEKIHISTSEDFAWKVLDVANRSLEAAADFAGFNLKLTWDEEHECYSVTFHEQEIEPFGHQTKYTPPRSDRLYNIRKTRVSPFSVVLSFRRNPQASRYKLFTDVRGAPILNYFTKQLKFKIEKAELKFARYEANNVKGPADRVIEILSTVYLSRIQTKFVTIMTAASFQDWKYLAAREEGNDEFMDGDILRITGNLAGRTVGYALRHAGKGLGGGVSTAATAVGQGIENASAAIGAKALGAGVNSVVAGVGEGVGDAVSGVGVGAGRVLQGAGQGVGRLFGGLTGGAMIMTKGIGKGITSGDGRAAASGIVEGVSAMGTGVGQGVESVVSGTADGVISVGQGLFSGVKNVGKGIGGAFLGKTQNQKKPDRR